jgi:tetratricopeptide (TPR) repeat protein
MPTLDPHGQERPSDGFEDAIVWQRRSSREVLETDQFIARARRAAASGAADEALGWYERARAALAGRGPSADLADVIRWKGSVHAECGDTSEADRLYQESGQISAAAGYLKGEAHALNCRATIAQRRGELMVAEAMYHRAAELANNAREVRLAAMIIRNLGIVASIRGHVDLAIARFQDSYDRAKRIGDDEGQCKALNNIATAYMESERFIDAEKAYLLAIRLARRMGDRALECGARINLCEAMIGLGKLSEAEVECMAALGIAEWRGDRLRRAEGLKVLAIIARRHGRDDEAIMLLDEAMDLTDTGEDALLAAHLRKERGKVARLQRNSAEAVEYFRSAREIFRRIGASRQVAELDKTIEKLSP